MGRDSDLLSLLVGCDFDNCCFVLVKVRRVCQIHCRIWTYISQ